MGEKGTEGKTSKGRKLGGDGTKKRGGSERERRRGKHKEGKSGRMQKKGERRRAVYAVASRGRGGRGYSVPGAHCSLLGPGATDKCNETPVQSLSVSRYVTLVQYFERN